jgi:hypothetical protein
MFSFRKDIVEYWEDLRGRNAGLYSPLFDVNVQNYGYVGEGEEIILDQPSSITCLHP